jgi:O-antigen ligase
MALVIVRRILGAAIGLALGLPLVAAWHEPAIPVRIKLAATVLLAIAAVSPAVGLCLVAGLLPMAFPLRVFARTEMNGSVIGELLALGFLSGAIVHLSFRRPVTSRLWAPAVVLGTLATASGVVLLSGAQASFLSLPGYLADIWQHYVFRYFVDSHDFGDLHLAVTWLEAVGLAVVAESVARRHPRAGRLAVQFAIAGAAVLAYFSARRLVEVSLRAPEPFAMAWRVISSIRFNPFYTDINAAGSLYALFVVPAIWLAAFGRQRLVWAGAGLLALACWLAGSRAAVGGVAVGLGASWILSGPRSRKYSWWGAAAVAAVALVVLIPTMLKRGSASVGDAVEIRQEMFRVSLRMTAVEPVFGVGLGRFRQASPAFISPEVLAKYGRLYVGENAHNAYLQLLAELGPAALVAFVWMLAATVGRPSTAPQDGALTAAHAGLVGGTLAFAISALAGHPLLTDHIRLCFFLALGLAAGLQVPAEPLTATAARWRTIRLVTVAFVVAIVAMTLPSRVRARRDAVNLDAVVVGASAESEGPEGVIYRVAEREASWFVPAAAKAVEVPVRADPASRAPCDVRFEIDGRAADAVTAPADAWRLVPVPLSASADRRSRRLVLYSPEGCRLMVGRLVVHH